MKLLRAESSVPDAAYERNKSEHEPIISLNVHRSKEERVKIAAIVVQTIFLFWGESQISRVAFFFFFGMFSDRSSF